MKKTCLRLLSVFLTVALLIPLFAITASAAEITLKSGAKLPEYIFVGHNYSLKVNGTTVNYYSSNKSVATVGETTGVLKALAPGKVRITAKSRSTGKAVAEHTFTVLQRATSVSADVETLYLAPGETYKLKATLTPETSTDVIRFISTDKTIATVGATTGNVTAIAAGETTITVYAKERSSTENSSLYNKKATVRVVVRKIPLTAEVTGENQVKVTFFEDVPDGITAENFSVTQTGSKSTPLGIESMVQYSSREILLTLAEPVFLATETSSATLHFISPDLEVYSNANIDLGTVYGYVPSLGGATWSGMRYIKEGTSGFIQFFGVDRAKKPYPLENISVNIISYTTRETFTLPQAGTVVDVDKVFFSYKQLDDTSIVVTYDAPVGTVADGANNAAFVIKLINEKGQMVFSITTSVDRAEVGTAYRLQFVSPEGEELFTPLKVNAGTEYQAPTPYEEGYTFMGWMRSDGAEGNRMPEQDLTLTAVFEKAEATTPTLPITKTATVSTDDWTYGSQAAKPTLHNGPEDALEVTYQYKPAEADARAWSKSVPTAAGDYQVRARIAVTEKYSVTTLATDFTIMPKEVTITGTAVEPSKPYDGEKYAEITDIGTLNGVADGDDVKIIPGSASYSDEKAGTGKTVTFSGFALDGADEGNYVLAAQPASVTADIIGTGPEISVEIAWDDMSFTYTAPSKGTWNPETHQYDNVTEGGWTSAGGNITVTNNGSETVAASFSYSPAEGMSGITGVFSQALLTVEPEKQAVTNLTLSGTPTETFENRQLGAVSVTVSKP